MLKLRPDEEEVLDGVLESKRTIPPPPPVPTNLNAKDRKLMATEILAVRKVAKNWAKHGHDLSQKAGVSGKDNAQKHKQRWRFEQETRQELQAGFDLQYG